MLLLNEDEVHTRKYMFWGSRGMDPTQWGPCATNVRTNTSYMDQTSVNKSFIVMPAISLLSHILLIQ